MIALKLPLKENPKADAMYRELPGLGLRTSCTFGPGDKGLIMRFPTNSVILPKQLAAINLPATAQLYSTRDLIRVC